jgi:hypothetical protein
LYTNANATNITSPTGGNISLSTNAGGSGLGAATGGNITIQTTSTGTGTPGNITIFSGLGGFTGTIDNFNIGASVSGTGKFTTLTATTGSFTGKITAASFSGDGTGITGITSINSASLGGISATDYVSDTDYYNSQLTPSNAIDLFPRTAIGGTRTLAAGTIYLTGFVPIKSFTLNSVTVVLTTAGTSSLQFGLFSTSGSIVTAIANTSLAVPSGAGAFTATFSTPQTLTSGSSYAIGFLAVGGTNPVIVGQTISTTNAAISYGLYPLMAANSSTTTYTSIPTSGSIALNSATPPSSFGWARLL